MKEITGLGWIMVVIFVILVLLTFIYCCMKISSLYDDEDKR